MNSSKLKASVFLSEFACIAPVASLYFLDLGITLGQIVMAQVLYSVGVLVAEVPTGVFADTFGRRVSIIVGHSISLLCVLAFLIVPGAGFLYAINFFLGVAGGFLSGSTEALLYESQAQNAHGPNNQGINHVDLNAYSKSYASLLSYGTLGFIAATALSAGILQLEAKSYRGLILITAAAQALSLLISLTLKEPRRSAASEAKLSQAMHQSLGILKHGMSAVYNNYTIFYLALAAIITNCGEYFLREMFQPLFAQASVSPSYFGMVLCLGSILNFFIVRNSYRLERYLSLPQFLLALYTLIASGYFVLSISDNHSLLIITAIILFGFFNADKPLISDYVNDKLPDSVRATALSTVSLAASFGTILSRISLSYVLDCSGLIAGFLAQALLLITGASIAFWAMARCNCIQRS